MLAKYKLIRFSSYLFSNVQHISASETPSSIANPAKTINNYTRPTPVMPYDRIREIKLDEVAELLSWSEIDWDLVSKLDVEMWQDKDAATSLPSFEVRALPEEERRKMQFDSRDWEDAVVIPWYRNKDQMMAYYVEDVCDWMTPTSPFPDEQYRTFDEYYRIKYGLEIQHKSQPLIDVDHISTRMNLLLPRFLSRKGHALNEAKLGALVSIVHHGGGRDNRNRQILIPELCSVHPLPASLWRKAICLPVILYRIQALLLMDELRVRLHNEAGIGLRHPRDAQWPPLCYGWSYAEKVLQLRSSGTPPVSGGDEKVGAVLPSSNVTSLQIAPVESEFLQDFLDSQREKAREQETVAKILGESRTSATAIKVDESRTAIVPKSTWVTSKPLPVDEDTASGDAFAIGDWSIDDLSADVREKMQDESLLMKHDVGGFAGAQHPANLFSESSGVFSAPSNSGSSVSSQAVFHKFRPPFGGIASPSVLSHSGSSSPARRFPSPSSSSTSIYALPNWAGDGGSDNAEEWPVPPEHKSIFAANDRLNKNKSKTAQPLPGTSNAAAAAATAAGVPVRITGSGWKDLPWSDLEYEIMEKVRQQKLRKKAARAAGLPYVAETDEFGENGAQRPDGELVDGEAGFKDEDYDGDELNLDYRIGFDSAQIGGVQKITKASTAVAPAAKTAPPAASVSRKQQRRNTKNENIPSVLDNVSYLAGGAAGGANATVIGAPPPPIVEEIDDDDDEVAVATDKMGKLNVSTKGAAKTRVLQPVQLIDVDVVPAKALPPPPSNLQFISGDDALTPDLLSSIRADMSKYEAGEQLDELKGLYEDEDDDGVEENRSAESSKIEAVEKNLPNTGESADKVLSSAAGKSATSTNTGFKSIDQQQPYGFSVVEPLVLLNIETTTSGKNVNNFVLASVCQMRTTYTFISSLDCFPSSNNGSASAQNATARVAMRLFEKQLADYNFDALIDVRLQCCLSRSDGRSELRLLCQLLRHVATWCGSYNVQQNCCPMMTQLKSLHDEIEKAGVYLPLSWCQKMLMKIYSATVHGGEADGPSSSNSTRPDVSPIVLQQAPLAAAASSSKAEFGESMAYHTQSKAAREQDEERQSESGSQSSSKQERVFAGALNVERITVQPAEPPFSFDRYEHQKTAEERAEEASAAPAVAALAAEALTATSAVANTSVAVVIDSGVDELSRSSSVTTNNSVEREKSWPGNDGGKKAGAIGRTLPTDYLDTPPPPPGSSPAILLFAFTASNANDGINLERLETVGDSFLKYSITVYLYVRYRNYHEGKLSYARSLLVSNSHLYKLGERKALGQYITANKFEPTDNWLPPCYIVDEKSKTLHHSSDENKTSGSGSANSSPTKRVRRPNRGASNRGYNEQNSGLTGPSPNLRTHHCVNDKTVADCVEALVGAVLVSGGTRDALALLNWLGLPTASFCMPAPSQPRLAQTPLMSDSPQTNAGPIAAGERRSFPSPSPSNASSSSLRRAAISSGTQPHQQQIDTLFCGLDEFESRIGYKFVHKHYIIQAFTHATYHNNRLTDCYQRLEFLGDAVLDYVITRHLFEDNRCFLPGELTDLRSALVNNAMFASLAVRYDFHKYLKLMSPQILRLVDGYVRKEKQRWQQHQQQHNGHGISTTNYEDLFSATAARGGGIGCGYGTLTGHEHEAGQHAEADDANDIVGDDDLFEAEETTVPKVLGDVFESVAGAIYLDSGMSLDAVWRVYFSMMHQDIEECCKNIPKSPVRALLEAEPDNVKFFKPERVANGKIRVEVQIFDKGRFFGLGRNYRAAKCTAARQALNYLREMGFIDEDGDDNGKNRRNNGVGGLGTLLADED